MLNWIILILNYLKHTLAKVTNMKNMQMKHARWQPWLIILDCFHFCWSQRKIKSTKNEGGNRKRMKVNKSAFNCCAFGFCFCCVLLLLLFFNFTFEWKNAASKCYIFGFPELNPASVANKSIQWTANILLNFISAEPYTVSSIKRAGK